MINQEDEFIAFGESKDVTSAVEEIESILPDLIIADISLKNSGGIDLVRFIGPAGLQKSAVFQIESKHRTFLLVIISIVV